MHRHRQPLLEATWPHPGLSSPYENPLSTPHPKHSTSQSQPSSRHPSHPSFISVPHFGAVSLPSYPLSSSFIFNSETLRSDPIRPRRHLTPPLPGEWLSHWMGQGDETTTCWCSLGNLARSENVFSLHSNNRRGTGRWVCKPVRLDPVNRGPG